MTVYAIAQLNFVDRAAYDRYQSGFLGVFAQFNGTLRAADEHPEVIEGQTDVEKVVLMSFPDRATSTARRNRPNTVESRQTGTPAQKLVLLVAGIPA